MHNNLIFPGFSAFYANRADGPVLAGPEVSDEAEESPQGQQPHGTGHPGGPAGTGADRFNRPPFSWLGGNAWPDFPR